MMALEVEVKGETFYSRESRKVMIRSFKPTSFIQTDKPIYLPGQTGNLLMIIPENQLTVTGRLWLYFNPCLSLPVQFRLISLDSMLKPSPQRVRRPLSK